MNEYPLLTVSSAFLVGLVSGGILRASPSVFVIVSLVGGFPPALAYGLSIGVPTWISALAVVGLDLFVTYAALSSLSHAQRYARAAPILIRIKRKYTPVSRNLLSKAGVLGIGGVLALTTLLVGWWVTVVVAFLLEVNKGTTLKATVVGLSVGAAIAWGSFEGLMRALPNPILVTAISMISLAIFARILTRENSSAKHTEQKPLSKG